MWIIRKRCFLWVVIGMCMAFLLSLFRCNKDKYILDGPGMERELWQEFTISRCSEVYEPIYSYTVKYDNASGEAYLYIGEYDEAKEHTSIQLKSQTINDLINMRILALPDEGDITGNFLALSVVNSNGKRLHKRVSAAVEKKILSLIEPYADSLNTDNGSNINTEREMWQEFTISQTSDEYNQNFSYTVKYDETEDKGYLYMEVPHETKGYPVLKSIELDSDTVNELINLNILSFTDEPKESNELEAEILDGTFLRFSVTNSSGNVFKKVISNEAEQKILTLITPYVQKIIN